MEEKKVETWVTKLLDEVEQFDAAMFPPVGEIEKGDTVIGDCPEGAKRYFSLAQYYRRECERIKLEEKYQASGISKDETIRFRQMDQKHDALMELFWGMVHDGVNTWELSIGVRKGWKVVETNPDPRIKIAGILGSFGA